MKPLVTTYEKFVPNFYRRLAPNLFGLEALWLAGLMALALWPTSHALGAGGGGGGDISLAINLSLVTSSQDDLNNLQQRANTRDGGITAGQLKNAYEGSVDFGYRINGGIYALHFRPAYFFQSESGTGSSGSYKYGVTGYSFFPILRIYPLENDVMKFFLQVGLGYGFMNGEIQEGEAQVKFQGSAYGSLVGLGAEFVIGGGHSIRVEGNVRYLGIQRNTAKSASGTFAANSLSQAETDREVELDSTDLSTTMSGIQALIGYVMTF